MKNKKITYLAPLILLLTVNLKGQILPVQPDYLQYSIRLYKPTENYAKVKPESIAHSAVRAYALYLATKQTKYLDDCKSGMSYIFDLWQANPEKMKEFTFFFDIYPICAAYDGLKNTGNIDPRWEPLLIKYISIMNTHAMGDHNQVYARASGLAYAMRLFPNHPQAADINKYIAAVWDQWYPNRDVHENAMHYCGIGIRDIIRIAKLTEREGLFKDPEIQKWIHRYRDIITPAGAMPEVGDDYFFAEWSSWLFNFEYFAKVFNDPTLIEVSWRLFANGNKNQTEQFDEMNLITSQVKNIKPVLAETKSLVTRRTVNGVKNIPDKMVLASSHIPGNPSVNMELYGFGSHGHPNRIGAIQYYEANTVPFFHNMMRRETDARFGNLIAVLPENDPIPVPINNTTTNSGISKTNTWYQQICETSRFRPFKASEDKDARRVSDVLLRLAVAKTNKDIQLIVDNFRLESADGTKVIPLDLCESLDRWNRADNPYSLVNDKKEGKSAVQIMLKAKGAANIFYGFKFPADSAVVFNCKDYPVLKFDWKQVAGNLEHTDLWFIARFENVDYNVGGIDKYATVKNAVTETKGEDCYGRADLIDYRFTGTRVNSTLLRKQVLTKEGVLILVDKVTPDEHATNYYAASLWHMYTKGRVGENWFDSPGEDKRTYFHPVTGSQMKMSLLVYYNKDKARTYSSELYKVGDATRFSTYAKEAVKAGKTTTFITVLVPHDPSVNPEAIANGILIDTSGGAIKISLKYPSPLYIQVKEGDNWKVSRTPV